MPTRLPQRPEQYFIDGVLLPNWQASGAVGYDVNQSSPSAEEFVPVATSLDRVGRTYPSLTVQRSTETAGGESGYDFITSSGPGQNRTGQLVVSAYAEDTEGDEGYTGDSSTYAAVTAAEIVDTLIDEVEDVCLRQANAPSTKFSYLSAFRAGDAPDDFDATPTVRIEQTTVQYAWIRDP